MFKFFTKNRNQIIYEQNSELKSVYFLKEGEIKYEAYLSVLDLHNITKYYIDYMNVNKQDLRLSSEQINYLKKSFLNDKDLIDRYNKEKVYKEKLNEINKYDIYSTKNPECLGILEFSSLFSNYFTTCFVISNNANYFEINKDNLNDIIKGEKYIIQKDYYKLIKNMILAQIKIFYNLKLNFLSNIKYKINKNYYNIHNNSENNINNDKRNTTIIETMINEQKRNKKNNSEYNIEANSFQNNINKADNKQINYIKIKKMLMKNMLIPKYFGHFNYKLPKNSNWSPVILRCEKYNEKYISSHKINLMNKKNFIDNNSIVCLNNSDDNYYNNDIIKTLLSRKQKKKKFDKFYLKYEKNRNLKEIINLGNNHTFTLEQLKARIKKITASESMINLSIVKNWNNKTMNQSKIKYKKERMKSILSYNHKYIPNFHFNKNKLKPNFGIIKNENSNYFHEINSLDLKKNNKFNNSYQNLSSFGMKDK